MIDANDRAADYLQTPTGAALVVAGGVATVAVWSALGAVAAVLLQRPAADGARIGAVAGSLSAAGRLAILLAARPVAAAD